MKANLSTDVTVADIHHVLREIGGWGSVYIPEFTCGNLRIDALLVDVTTRWARGFEIKVSRTDFLRDEKWQRCSEFCSSLSIVCPSGLIAKEEVPDPFGLLYVLREPSVTDDLRTVGVKWVKKPKRFQRRDGMAWTYTYLKILEKELPRLAGEVERLRTQLQRESRAVRGGGI